MSRNATGSVELVQRSRRPGAAEQLVHTDSSSRASSRVLRREHLRTEAHVKRPLVAQYATARPSTLADHRRIGDFQFGDRGREVPTVVGHEAVCSRDDGRGQVDGIGSSQPICGDERGGDLGRRGVNHSQIQAAQQPGSTPTSSSAPSRIGFASTSGNSRTDPTPGDRGTRRARGAGSGRAAWRSAPSSPATRGRSSPAQLSEEHLR